MPRIEDYQEALRLAEDALKCATISDVAKRAGADFALLENGAAALRLSFFTEPVCFRIGKTLVIEKGQAGTEIPIQEKIILCHYLLHATGNPPAGKIITFRQIPDGHFYDEAFQRRTRDPFLSRFGSNPDLFRTCARSLGATPVAMGDAGMAFQVLPRISIQLILWKGDEELSPQATLLFDNTIQHYLPAEDIAVLSGMLVFRLIGSAHAMKANRNSTKG